MRPMLNRLTTRLVLSQLLVVALAMGLLVLVLLSLVQSYFVQAAQQSLLVMARLTAQAFVSSNSAVSLPGANVTQSQLPAASNAVQSQTALQVVTQATLIGESSNLRLNLDVETRIRVFDPSGVALTDSAGQDTGRDLSGTSLVANALRNQEGAGVEGDGVVAAVPLQKDGVVAGAVLLSQPLRDVNAVLADLRFRLLISALAGLALAAGVGAVLARGIARPVRQLTAAAHELSGGNFDYPLDVASRDELGELARAFDSMSGDLRRLLQARTDLVSNVSHELRTPLTAIKGLVETLRDGAVEDIAVRDSFLASIEQETDRLIRLVNDLLILSRADSGALALHVKPVDLTALAHSCIETLAPRAADQGITLRVESGDAPDRVNADPDRIRQVALNLLDNAIRFSSPGQAVTVSVGSTRDDKGVRVEVRDQGCGIAPEEQARVFERFYRGDRSRARQSDTSAGLGLSIAQTLVEAHGGQIGIDSAPGRGTTVWFTLPARM